MFGLGFALLILTEWTELCEFIELTELTELTGFNSVNSVKFTRTRSTRSSRSHPLVKMTRTGKKADVLGVTVEANVRIEYINLGILCSGMRSVWISWGNGRSKFSYRIYKCRYSLLGNAF